MFDPVGKKINSKLPDWSLVTSNLKGINRVDLSRSFGIFSYKTLDKVECTKQIAFARSICPIYHGHLKDSNPGAGSANVVFIKRVIGGGFKA